jgi:hypothetical protein
MDLRATCRRPEPLLQAATAAGATLRRIASFWQKLGGAFRVALSTPRAIPAKVDNDAVFRE